MSGCFGCLFCDDFRMDILTFLAFHQGLVAYTLPMVNTEMSFFVHHRHGSHIIMGNAQVSEWIRKANRD